MSRITALTLEERVLVPGRRLAEVFAYVSDFGRAAEWRAEVTSSEMSPPAPMRLGSRLRETSRIAGREVVTESLVDGFDDPTFWSFAHVSGPLPVSGTYRFAPVLDGVELTYRLDVRLPGLWALGTPFLRWSGRRTIRRSLARLVERLSPE